MENPNLTTIVKDNRLVNISHCIAGVIYYEVIVDSIIYLFPVDMNNKDDVGTASFPARIKAVTLMRYIRKALVSGEFVKVGTVVDTPKTE